METKTWLSFHRDGISVIVKYDFTAIEFLGITSKQVCTENKAVAKLFIVLIIFKSNYNKVQQAIIWTNGDYIYYIY